MEEHSCHHWLDYDPGEPQYYNFEANVVAAGSKIADVYEQFSNARMSLEYMECKNFGDLISKTDELHLTMLRSRFLKEALAYYNYCIDLSWQVLWYFYGENDLGLIIDENRFFNSASKCNFEELTYKLTLAKEFKIRERLKSFFNSNLTREIRDMYNYLKHRGSTYTEGLGVQYEHLAVSVGYENPDGSVNEIKHRMLTRRTLDISSWQEKLKEFDKTFYHYFEELIKYIMPIGYLDNSYHMFAPYYYDKKIRSYIESR